MTKPGTPDSNLEIPSGIDDDVSTGKLLLYAELNEAGRASSTISFYMSVADRIEAFNSARLDPADLDLMTTGEAVTLVNDWARSKLESSSLATRYSYRSAAAAYLRASEHPVEAIQLDFGIEA